MLVVLDERFRETDSYRIWKAGEAEGVLDGCWHVWNLLKHCGLERVVDVTATGAQWPIGWPARWGEVRWKAFSELPEMAEEHRKTRHYQRRLDCYRRSLEGNPVRLTLPTAIDKVQGWLLSPAR